MQQIPPQSQEQTDTLSAAQQEDHSVRIQPVGCPHEPPTPLMPHEGLHPKRDEAFECSPPPHEAGIYRIENSQEPPNVWDENMDPAPLRALPTPREWWDVERASRGQEAQCDTTTNHESGGIREVPHS